MKDAISILHTLNSINFIKNIKEKINNKENAVTNKDYLSIIENSNVNDDIMDILDGKNNIFELLTIMFLIFIFYILFYFIKIK